MTVGLADESLCRMVGDSRTTPFARRIAMQGLVAIAFGVAVAAGATGAAIARAREERGPAAHPPVLVVAEPMLPGAVVLHGPPPRSGRKATAERRAPFARARDGVPTPVELTAYCLSGTTRRGRWVRPGIIATDPRVFPLSRYVEIFVGEKYLGRFLVDDTGRLIKDDKIDIWVPTCREAKLFGRVRGTAVLVPRR